MQHLINKLEGLPQLRAVDQHEAGILASRLSEEYQDLLGKVDPYLSAESLPQGLDEDHIFSVVAQIEDIYVRGSVLASKLTTRHTGWFRSVFVGKWRALRCSRS